MEGLARPKHASAESLLVDLTRGKRANYVFFAGKRPEEETHLPAPDTTPPRELLAKAMRRERAKTMALDLVARAGQVVEGPGHGLSLEIDWGTAPATEAQLAWIADLGREAVVQGRMPTWVEASLLIDTTGEAAEGWLREQGASEAEARDVVETTRRRLTGEDVAESDRPAVVEPNALRALEERLQAELDRDGTTGMRDRMLEAARRWEARLQATQPADRGPELLEERLHQLEEKEEPSRAQEAEREQLRNRRRGLLRGQQPSSRPPAGPGGGRRGRDEGRREAR